MNNIDKIVFRFNTQFGLYPGPFILDAKYNWETVEVMKRVLKKDSNCIDVGCHKGDVLKFMMALSPKGSHVGFEPIPELYNLLQKKFGNRAKFYNLALSDEKGKVSFNYVVSNPGYSGMKKRRYDRPEEQDELLTVNTDLLDNLIPTKQKVDFIKIDVEGAELQVLRGAKKIISKNKPVIVFEHGLGAADVYGTKPEQIFDLLKECGLRISTMEYFLSDKEPLDRHEFANQFKKGYNYYFIAYP